jgi:mediator of RNA polymerase II transcription subunit 24
MKPQSRILAKLCVYSILSTIDTPDVHPQKKRPRSDDDEDLSPMAKMRKTNLEQQSVGAATEGMTGEKDQLPPLKESLQSSLMDLFKIFHQQVVSDEMSAKVNFIFEFLSLLVQFEKGDKIKPILKLIPAGLVVNLLKIIPQEELSYGFILR